MTTGLGFSAYIDISDYQEAPHGQEIVSLLGLSTTTNGATQPAGTTALVVVSTSANASWTAGLAWILDGPASEIVSVTASPDGTHLTLAAPGTQFAHTAGVSVSQAGASGCLASTILRACGALENYCQQGASGGDRSLYALTRSERWAMPSVRAYLDRDATLAIMPGHFPVQSVSAVAVEFGQGQSLALDASQIELPTSARVVEFPYLVQGGVSVGMQMFLGLQGISRSRRQWATLTYLGGITPGAVPADVEQAAIWITSDLLSQRQNPTGAAEQSLGKRRLVQRQRGDAVGDSILLLRAHDALQPYVAEAWA
jgi:hypothetical protein